METIRLKRIARRKSAGHSLIEMLVVLIIVVGLLAISVPAIQHIRETARRTQCINHQTDLAKAVDMYVAHESYGRFPGYRALAADGGSAVGWAAQVFPYLGRNDLDPSNPLHVNVLVCPSDPDAADQPRLSYVVNGGQPFIDSPADGIFFDHIDSYEQRIKQQGGSVAIALDFSRTKMTDAELADVQPADRVTSIDLGWHKNLRRRFRASESVSNLLNVNLTNTWDHRHRLGCDQDAAEY